jgi:hypothetical protein
MIGRPTPAPRGEALEAVQITAGDAGHDAMATCDFTTILPQSRCPHHVSPGPLPHDQRQLHGLKHPEVARWPL